MTDPFADLESFDVPDVDIPDFPPDDDHSPTDSTPDGPLCEVCSTVIPWSGRGRKPKYCQDHKRRTSPRDSGDLPRAPRKSAKLEARLSELESDLTREMALLGKGASFALPVFGVTVVDRSARTAKALTKIAARNPKVLEALEISTKVVDAFDLGEVGLALGVAILVDLKRLNPDGALPQMLGVSEIYHAVHDEEQTPVGSAQVSVNGVNPFEVNVPPRFQEVR